jgi:hypothetical protein
MTRTGLEPKIPVLVRSKTKRTLDPAVATGVDPSLSSVGYSSSILEEQQQKFSSHVSETMWRPNLVKRLKLPEKIERFPENSRFLGMYSFFLISTTSQRVQEVFFPQIKWPERETNHCH